MKASNGCGRAVCKPTKLTYYNHSTRKKCCKKCALHVNKEMTVYDFSMFGHEICTPLEVDANAMKTSQRSQLMLEFENKLHNAEKELELAKDAWLALNAEESYAAGLCYPSYLPSFDEFVLDMDFWLQHLANRDNQS